MKLLEASSQLCTAQGKIRYLMRNSVGQDTKTFIQSQGNLEPKPFFRDVRKFFSSAADFMVSKFPFGDELLTHAVVADIANRQSVKFRSLSAAFLLFCNADCERIFSLVTKNKTQYKICLSTAISALVTRKASMAAKWTVT